MKKSLMQKLRGTAALLCCAAVAFFHSSARAEDGEHVETSARSAILIERTTGKILFSHNSREKLPMASTTKVMTALLALERGNMEDVVTVSRNAYGVPGTSIYLSMGEKITLHDLLFGLMLASGNDAAVAIAEHIGGNVNTFCEMMTQRAAELGCTDTCFTTPHGLPADGHYTTAHDLALIARQAMSHELFRQIVSTRRATVPWEGRSYSRILNNKNRLLSDYAGATGIKTGYTRAAGRCLVFGAERDGLELIGVVLNCGNWFEEAERLMDLGFSNYEMFTALDEGEMVRVLPVKDGTQETVVITAGGTLAAPVGKNEIPMLEYDLPADITAGLEQGECIGEARMLVNGKVIASVSLVAGETLAKRDYAFELERMIQNWPVQPQPLAE